MFLQLQNSRVQVLHPEHHIGKARHLSSLSEWRFALHNREQRIAQPEVRPAAMMWQQLQPQHIPIPVGRGWHVLSPQRYHEQPSTTMLPP